MKTTKKSLLLFACCAILFGAKTNAQISNFFNINIDFLKKVQSRTVIVEIKEEDPKLVEKLSKKEKNADRLQHYRDFISTNNEMLKKAVDKFWKYNAKIEYKTTTEINALRGKSDEYYEIISTGIISDNEYNLGESLSIPVIFYDNSGITSKTDHDYDIYLPVSSIPEKEINPMMWLYKQSDYDFAIIEMQAHFNYMLSVNKKINFEDYGVKMSEANCGKIKSNTLVIDRGQLYEKVDESTIKNEYKGPFVLTDSKTYDDTYDNQEQGKEVIFSFAYGIAKGGFTAMAFFSKAVVNCNTGDILYYYKAPTFGVAWTMFDIRKQIFDYMEKCN